MISNVWNIAGDFNAHIGVVEPGDEESIRRFEWSEVKWSENRLFSKYMWVTL